ncbi:DUF58 domain-containing protein [Nakamurella silvestris]|nr:DUF58 domain-containing protein [Nakamurella silvestris]
MLYRGLLNEPVRPIRANRRGLTTRGRCLLAGGIAAVICAVILDERDLLRVGILAVAIPVIAWAVTATRRTALTATHQVQPELIRPGTTGRITLTITNAGRGRTRAVEITEAATPDLTAGVHCLLPPLKRGRSGVATYRLQATRRGRFVLGPPRAQMGDPFGTWEDTRNLSAVTEVLVVPSVVALHGMPASAGSRSAASGRTTVGTVGGEPDVGIRPYQRGDDLRTVHWRMSARHDDLMVRLNEPVSHGGATILLDHRAAAHRGTGAGSSLESAITFAASIALHLLTADHRVTLINHGGLVLADGHNIADDVLAALATVEEDQDDEVEKTAAAVPGLLIAVLGDLDPTTARLLVAGRRRSANAIAILLDTPGWDPTADGPPAGTTETAAVLRAGGWRVVVLRRPDDLGQAWRQVCAVGNGYSADRRIS